MLEAFTRHLFVETNWLYEYAAPAHHKVLAAIGLLERARQGEFVLYIPNVSFAEARHAVQAKCQPTDGPGIHRYIRWARECGELTGEQSDRAHHLAEQYVQAVRKELDAVPALLADIAKLPFVKVFALDDEMLSLANELALTNSAQKPFDHAILAGILVMARRLWARGERRISFAERDGDLQPWGTTGSRKDDLRRLYREAHIWVYGDFTLQFPPRPADFE